MNVCAFAAQQEAGVSGRGQADWGGWVSAQGQLLSGTACGNMRCPAP